MVIGPSAKCICAVIILSEIGVILETNFLNVGAITIPTPEWDAPGDGASHESENL